MTRVRRFLCSERNLWEVEDFRFVRGVSMRLQKIKDSRRENSLPKALEWHPSLAPDPLHVAEANVQAQEIRRLEEWRDPQAGHERVHGEAELGQGSGALEHVVLELVEAVHREIQLAQRRQRPQQVLRQTRQLVARQVQPGHGCHGVEGAGLDEHQAAVLALEAIDAEGIRVSVIAFQLSVTRKYSVETQ